MKHIIAALIGAVLGLTIVTLKCQYKITNLERQQLRIEQEYQRVITQNEQLKRINEQNLRLMAEGGW